jgi:hypothetical protein
MLKHIEFTAFGCCSAIGNFEPGDKARLPADIAAHLVDEARCAKYSEPVAAPEPKAEPVRKRKGR